MRASLAPSRGSGRGRRILVAAILSLVTALAPAAAQDVSARPQNAVGARPALQSRRITQPPVIDGVLDDEAWQCGADQTGDWLSYNPLYGDSDPAEDQRVDRLRRRLPLLRVSVRRSRARPAIKTSITRRDNIWSDDWVGISLDALGTGQLSYHLMVNPSGVQLDMLNSVAGGEDQSPDCVWDSAGRLNDKGYAVEMRLPLQTHSLQGRRRRPDGHPVLAPRQPRRASRSRGRRSSPASGCSRSTRRWRSASCSRACRARSSRRRPMRATQRATRRHGGARPTTRRTSASAPSTASRRPSRSMPRSIPTSARSRATRSRSRSTSAFRSSSPRSVRSSWKAPASSRWPAQGNDNSLQRAVHTRRIIDPLFGAKVTGQPRPPRVRHADRARPGRRPHILPDGRSRRPARIASSTSAAAQYSLGPEQLRRRLVIDAEFAGGFNRVVGADLSWRVTSTQRVSGFVLASSTRAPHAADAAWRRRAGGLRVQHASARPAATPSTTTATSRWRRRSSTASASPAAGATPSTASIRTRRSIPGCGGCRRSRSRRAGAIATPAATSCSR